ncbi:hypothetical protein HP567_028835 [Brevibacillus sp. M2.1A]|uniref:hypothetical protein n=1 Tax=Brevibacillus sp. M2.1A TaxID=2738980 RepID=UPI00156B88C4|nr:hypothetical protein [Brevibacillus sp. M2.1A]MCC8438545.1 hypothetical protein [Brevibacillus sp. M2.1A]
MPRPKKEVPKDILSIINKGEKNYFLNRVGEYGTIAKLSRWGIDAFLTLGNKKSFDIVVTGNKKSFNIQVKTSKETFVPTGFFQTYYDTSIPTPDFWVLVRSFAIKDEVYSEQYYVMKHEELMNYHTEKLSDPSMGMNCAEDLRRRERDLRRLRKENPDSKKYRSGVDRLYFNEIQEWENRFCIIVEAIKT